MCKNLDRRHVAVRWPGFATIDFKYADVDGWPRLEPNRRSYLTPAGESTLSKRNALLGSSNSSQTSFQDPYGGSLDPHTAGNGTYYGSRSPSPFGGARPASSNSQYASNRTAEDLESQNEEELEGLGAKVKMLKDVCISPSTSFRVF